MQFFRRDSFTGFGFHQDASAVFFNDEVDLHPVLVPVKKQICAGLKLQGFDQLHHHQVFPEAAFVGMIMPLPVTVYSQQVAQQAVIPEIQFRRFDQAFPDIGMKRRQQIDQTADFQSVDPVSVSLTLRYFEV